MGAHRDQSCWTDAEDAALCEAVANGSSIAKAGRMLGRSKGSAIGRFWRLAKQFGWQAA